MEKIPLAITLGVVGAMFGGALTVEQLTRPEDYPDGTIAVVPSETPEATLVDYSDGAWHFTRSTDGYGLAVDCPSEDSCDVHYSDGAWVVTRVVP